MKSDISRRNFTAILASILAAGGAGVMSPATQGQSGEELHDMEGAPEEWTGGEHIYMLAYPGMTALDLVGPQYMFASLMGAKVEVVAKSRTPIITDTGLTIMPDATFSDLPAQLTVFFAPGGTVGTLKAIQDAETVEFVRAAGSSSQFITSVCTGSLILGKAGLLNGYNATSHWLTLPLLSKVGATPVNNRVVSDRNRITGAGVSAGLDFGLQMVSEFRGVDYAETVQLLCEYSPEPPLNSGSPETAKDHQIALLRNMLSGFLDEVDNEI